MMFRGLKTYRVCINAVQIRRCCNKAAPRFPEVLPRTIVSKVPCPRSPVRRRTFNTMHDVIRIAQRQQWIGAGSSAAPILIRCSGTWRSRGGAVEEQWRRSGGAVEAQWRSTSTSTRTSTNTGTGTTNQRPLSLASTVLCRTLSSCKANAVNPKTLVNRIVYDTRVCIPFVVCLFV